MMFAKISNREIRDYLVMNVNKINSCKGGDLNVIKEHFNDLVAKTHNYNTELVWHEFCDLIEAWFEVHHNHLHTWFPDNFGKHLLIGTFGIYYHYGISWRRCEDIDVLIEDGVRDPLIEFCDKHQIEYQTVKNSEGIITHLALKYISKEVKEQDGEPFTTYIDFAFMNTGAAASTSTEKIYALSEKFGWPNYLVYLIMKESHRYYDLGKINGARAHLKWNQSMCDYKIAQIISSALYLENQALDDGFEENEEEENSLHLFEALTSIRKLREQEMKARYPEHKLGLKKETTAKEFFSQHQDKLKYVFVHDKVHKIIAKWHGEEEALYRRMLIGETKTSWDLFTDDKVFTPNDRVRNSIEEAMVLGIERGLVKHWRGNDIDHYRTIHSFNDSYDAFLWGLMRVCTNIWKGKWRDWANDHWLESMSMFLAENNKEQNYWAYFIDCYKNGEIQFTNKTDGGY